MTNTDKVPKNAPIRVWRFRALLIGFVELPVDRSILCWKATFKHLNNGIQGQSIYLLDVFMENSDPTLVFWRGLDLSWKIADALAFMSLSQVTIQALSVVPPTVTVSEVFEIVISEASFTQSRAQVDSNHLVDVADKIDEKTAGCFRSFREALSTENPLHAFSLLWNGSEPIFKDIAKNDQLLSDKRQCKKCGAILGLGEPSATKGAQKIMDALARAKGPTITPKQLFGFRSTIVHGAKLADTNYRNEVERVLPAMFSLAARALAETSTAQTCFSNRMRIFQTLAHFHLSFPSAGKVDFRWDYPGGSLKTMGAIIDITKTFSRGQENEARCMLQEQNQYNPLYLPDMT